MKNLQLQLLTRITTLILMVLFALPTFGQVRKEFAQRASYYTPNKKIYNIQGDFQMIGNTNMTLQSYGVDESNSGQMIYVDVDNDAATVNSSSAELQFSGENGAVDDCTNIIYAGLYWTGRPHDGSNSPEEFITGGTTSNRTNGNSFNGYSLSITSANDNSNNTSDDDRRVATYTFTPQGGGDAVVFRFYSWNVTSGWIFTSTTYYGLVT